MYPIYVGDAHHIGKRLRQHQSGNVEASALRKHIARAMGFGIKSERRASGSYRKRLDLDDPNAGEEAISQYIRIRRCLGDRRVIVREGPWFSFSPCRCVVDWSG